MESKKFKTTYILRGFTGNWNPISGIKLTLTEQYLEIAQRNWYGISVDRDTIHFQNVLAIDVDKHLFGATLKIHMAGVKPKIFDGFSKRTANAVKEECKKYIHLNTQKSTTDALSDSIASAIANVQNNSNSSKSNVSAADEILKFKKLFEQGIITKEEFDIKKYELLYK